MMQLKFGIEILPLIVNVLVTNQDNFWTQYAHSFDVHFGYICMGSKITQENKK